MNSRSSFILAVIAVCTATAHAADSAWRDNRLLPLGKVTTGPWDNYEATVDAGDQSVYFTRALNQIPNVYRQDVRADEASLFLQQSGDTKDPALDASGKRIAFTYFGEDAQGDVCVAELPGKNLHCLTDAETADTSAFWIDANHLGFLRRQTAQLVWQLVAYDLTTQQSEVLRQGPLSAPAASPDGRYIAFNQTGANGQVRVHILDRQTGAVQTPAPFKLPGITGFMAFSRDGQFLYFNHYLSDTNLDQVIDGNDHSVIFRVPFRRWLETDEPLLPEQLTSVADNCKFPATSNKSLYLTCAFGGTLDVYRMPLSGSVPAEWDEQQLWEAHRIARSHQARLLILNTLRYRFKHDEADITERLLSDHLELGELSAATYYVAQLSEHYRTAGDRDLAGFYQTLGLLLKVRSAKQRVPVGLVTARFRTVVADARQQLHADNNRSVLADLMDAYLDYELENFDNALATLHRIDLRASMPPMERYLAFELYRRLLEQNDPHTLLDYYPAMFNAASLPTDATLYYSFEYLKLLGRVESAAARVEVIAAQLTGVTNNTVAELFRAEIFALRLAGTTDKKQQGELFKALMALLKADKNDTVLRKTLHTRTIQILGDAGQFPYMEALSRHWLTTTHVSEMEFFNVAEQFFVITMDKAYGMMSQGERAKAYSTFYSAIRQTDDLEAHYQFITLGLDAQLHKRDNLEQSYQILEHDGLLGQNRNYVQALRLVMDAEAKEKLDNKKLDDALTLLNAMDARGLNPAMRDLLMGYIYHRKLRASRQGYGYDKALFQKAHHHYMMAFDMARDNGRILASVWQNLAALHFEVGNYALSAAFFARRMELPFTTPAEQAVTQLAYARALFYKNELQPAQQQAEAALIIARQDTALPVTPFIEKAAFYAMQAGAYDQAAKRFEELLRDDAKLSAQNKAKVLLGYGYTLRQAKNRDAARTKLRELIGLSNQLKSEPEQGTRLLSFHPERLRLIAYGLLADLTDDPNQRAAYRLQRIAVLKTLSGRSREFAYEESDLLSFIAKDYHHLAVVYEQTGQFDKMADAMDEALKASLDWVKETDDELGPVIYRTLINHLSLALSHPQVVANRKQLLLQTTCERVLAAYAKLSYRPATIVAQQAKLALLWEAYRGNVLQQDKANLRQRLERILNTEEVRQAETGQLQSFAELRGMSTGLVR